MIKDRLEIIADIAAILTAAVATLAYVRFAWGERKRRLTLEAYLRAEAMWNEDDRRRTVLHLVANLAMTESEVLHAAFRSDKVRTIPGQDEQGRAVRLYFQYAGLDLPPPKTF